MLFERDYSKLTPEETAKLAEAEEYKRKNQGKLGEFTPGVLYKYHDLKPNASYYYQSLFPNNFLSRDTLIDTDRLVNIEKEFIELLDSDITERSILNFINENKYYNLIASLFHVGYEFGHHDAYLFKEFELPSTYKADYLLIGKNSHGYHFVFVELENPSKSITLNSGEFGQTIRKGIKQVRDWNKWIEGNFHTINLIFNKLKNKEKELPNEFRSLNKSRLHYTVIAGRRKDFNEETYDAKRRLEQAENIKVLHYDNLIDSFKRLQKNGNY